MKPVKIKPSTETTRLKDRSFLLSKVQDNSLFIWMQCLGVDHWIKLFDVADLGGVGTAGTDGREIELQNDGTHIKWRYVGDSTDHNLVALVDLKGDTGAAGAAGTAGTNGTNGADGRDTEFRRTATHIQWSYVDTGVWFDLVLLTDIKGDTGAAGADGAQGIQGIQGIQGVAGTAGTNGTNGTDGNVWRSGSGVPSNALGNNNDYYLDTATGDVYKKAAGTYSVQGNIKGATGSQGIQGIQGIQGVAGNDGTNGTNGQGVPVGGSAGQVLSKIDGTNYNTQWLTVSKSVVNQSVAAQGAGFATDTYLTGSNIAIPSGALKAGTRYHLVFYVSKTAAGIATPIITIRFGTAGSTADTARLTFTFLAQTAAADVGQFEVFVTFRSVGSGTSAVIQGGAKVVHSLASTGLQNLAGKVLQVTSAGFDSTVSNSIIGASVNGGASAAWTVQLVQAELSNIN